MKTTTLLSLICCALIASASGLAAAGPDAQPQQRPGPPHGDQRHGDETRLLQHLLEMDDSQLANLRQTIERIEKMPPEEKARLRERIGKMHKMDPEHIEAIREQYEAIPKAQREAMRHRWTSMTAEERAEWRQKLREMSPEEREAVFEEQGFMPPQPGKDRKGPRPPPKEATAE